MSESESQSYCQKGFTCINFNQPECPFKNEGKIFFKCEVFKPAFIVEKDNEKEVFAIAITRREFLMLPMETRRRILERQAAAFLGDG